MSTNLTLLRGDTALTGYLLLAGSFVFFVVGMYSCLISKWMPVLGHPLLDFLREDYYYSLLLPLLIPVFIVAVYLNWYEVFLFNLHTRRSQFFLLVVTSGWG